MNKVLLPRPEKRTVAYAADLFVMESLSKFEPLNLQALTLDHMYKTIIEHKGKHGMGYGHILTKVFKHLNIPVGLGTIGTAKQESRTTEQDVSVGNGKKSLKHELEEMTVIVSNKDAEIALLKVELLKAQTEGPGTEAVKELRLQNDALLVQNASI
ncbi:hypothetical protein KY285_000697 [Solanum tuberosum]|nr:hypothetical protein KY285_000697 [Solanum tuberosum]